ncbi:hypothetical protein A4X06_0g7797 [Tilletia controversa]|uniref:Uncharacterized protein n=1 Tax=Tilletia controversa TaxID=13291 RepID=A0A8X7STS7_9BASI|nr:hypothetical protein A4X06_0g7797 [Tilletia controversa]
MGRFCAECGVELGRLPKNERSTECEKESQNQPESAGVGVPEYGALRGPPRPSLPGAITSKLSARKLGPYAVAEVLSPHRIRIALPSPLRIHDEFSVEQLDALPVEQDPFALHRSVPLPDSDAPVDEDDSQSTADLVRSEEEHVPRPTRAARLPSALREYDVGSLHVVIPDGLMELLRIPSPQPRVAEVDGKTMVLEERPVAFLSRLTTMSEKKLVAPELKLSCLA